MTGVAFCVLASGSGGNCTAIRLEDPDGRRRVVLVDLGLSPRMTRGRLRLAGCSWSQVTDVLLTHLDSDHFRAGWLAPLRHAALTVHASAEHCRSLREAGVSDERLRVVGRDGEPGVGTLGPETSIETIPLPHDEGWTSGWLLEHSRLRLGYATDLGTPPPVLLTRFTDLDAVLFESNYDPVLQLASRRPEFLKRRIMGGRGHLSNEQALDALLAISTRSERLQRIALLHLSRQCNDPEIVRRLWLDRAPHLADRLMLTSQHAPSPMVALTSRTTSASLATGAPLGTSPPILPWRPRLLIPNS